MLTRERPEVEESISRKCQESPIEKGSSPQFLTQISPQKAPTERTQNISRKRRKDISR